MSTSRNFRRKARSAEKRSEGLEEDDYRAVSVRLDADSIAVRLEDGSEHSASVDEWFPFLRALTAAQRRRTKLMAGGTGISFPDIEEFASVFSVVHPERTTLAAPLRDQRIGPRRTRPASR